MSKCKYCGCSCDGDFCCEECRHKYWFMHILDEA